MAHLPWEERMMTPEELKAEADANNASWRCGTFDTKGKEALEPMSNDIVNIMRGQSDWFKSLPKGATTRIEPELAEDISAVLDMAVNEIERLRRELDEANDENRWVGGGALQRFLEDDND